MTTKPHNPFADPFVDTIDLTDYLGRDVTADNGALIATDAACEIIRAYAEQSFNAGTAAVVTLDGSGTDCLLLPELPVTAAGTVIEAGETLTLDTDYVLADNGRLIRTSGGSFTSLPNYAYGRGPWGYGGWSLGGGAVWPEGRQNVQVTYDYGGTIPNSVRMIALQLAERIYVQGPAVFEALSTGQQVRYAGPALDLTPGEKIILRKYRPMR